jgi:PadR family transcriptional regulator, regulatory protein PadR
MAREIDRYCNRIELLQGTLDMLVLQTLRSGAQHGYGISQALKARSSDALQVETGSLYPALHRMERQGWVVSEWRQTGFNQRAKFYRITASGRRHLEAGRTKWEAMVAAITSVLDPAPEL